MPSSARHDCFREQCQRHRQTDLALGQLLPPRIHLGHGRGGDHAVHDGHAHAGLLKHVAVLVGEKKRRWVFKDCSGWHSNLRRHENWFLGLTSAWKLVIMPA